MRQLALGAALLAVCATLSPAQQPADDFRQNCINCHTIGGGRLTGPDLKGVTERQQRDWLIKFIQAPKAVIDGGDPYAQELLQQARGVVMATIAGMTPGRAGALLDLIEAESQLEESQFKGLQMSDRPFTGQDVAAGRGLFTGQQRLLTGGPACLSCHTVKGLGGLSGGRLGPDLSRAFERLGGRQSMGAWLMAPPTPTMQPLFRAHPLDPTEILPLIAFLEDATKQGGEDQSVSILNFFFLGLGGTVVVLAAFDAIWKKRFRGVRAALVERNGRTR
jgi:mono/diheme cytochrome c family protein